MSVHYNPLSRAVQEDPYPVYRQLRDEAPVYHNRDLDIWALSRYDDVLGAMQNPGVFISGQGITIDGIDKGQHHLSNTDDPEHRTMRAPINPYFSARAIKALEPALRRHAAVALEGMRERQEIDFAKDFSVELPLWVIGELLGLPAEIRPEVHRLSMEILAREEMDTDPQAPQAALHALEGLGDLLLGVIRERRRRPREDLISFLATSRLPSFNGDSRMLDDETIVSRCREMTIAGHETSALLICAVAVTLGRFRSTREVLIGDSTLVPQVVEEVMRWDGPIQYTVRVTGREVALHSSAIPEGARVVLINASANRDERAFRHPDTFDIRRARNHHLGFQNGVHHCIGATLARRETAIAIEELLRLYPGHQIDLAGCIRSFSEILRGYTSVPMLLDA